MLKLTRNNGGFTLVEFAIVIAIFGILLSSSIQLYSIYIKGRFQSSTYESMDKFNTAINAFYSTQKRYPCPAFPTLPEANPLAGVEQCAAAAATAIGSCTNGLCKTTGRDADGNGTADQILIGSIPYKTLKLARDDFTPLDGTIQDDVARCNRAVIAGGAIPTACGTASMQKSQAATTDINSRDSVDARGNRMTYAVSSRLTSNAAGNFDVSFGAISVQTETGVELTDPPGSVLWIVVSHGDDGVGSYTSGGKLTRACAGASKDVENCDNDDLFVNGIRIMVQGANYFDDLTYYSVTRLSSLWTSAQTNSTAGSNEDTDIANLNIGNVGIGVASPTERLDVAGAIRAKNFMSTQICGSGGTDCFNPATFGSTAGTVCGAGSAANKVKVVTGIRNGNIVCDEELTLASSVTPDVCPVNKEMIGVTTTGTIICEP